MEGFVVAVKAILLRGYIPLWHSRIDPDSIKELTARRV
jgi:hypothetical protein